MSIRDKSEAQMSPVTEISWYSKVVKDQITIFFITVF